MINVLKIYVCISISIEIIVEQILVMFGLNLKLVEIFSCDETVA